MKNEHGTVIIKDDRYKISGPFHRTEKNSPIWKGDKLCGVTNPRDMTYIHSYGGEGVFFQGLSEGKLIGSKCVNPNCETTGSIYMPFRIHCPDCLGKNKPEEITERAKKSAKIHTFMICERSGAFNALPTPIKFINIEFDGVVTILMSYLSVGTPEIGMRVLPIFRKKDPTYTIMDLSWIPEGTDLKKIPDGFSL